MRNLYVTNVPVKGNTNISAVTAVGTTQCHSLGITLAEVMVAIVILMVSVIGVSSAHVAGRREIIKQRRYQEAIQLAAQKIEECRAIGYINLAVGQTEEMSYGEGLDGPQVYLSGLTCVRTTTVELTAQPSQLVPAPCKKVTVSVAWTGTAGVDHDIELVTLIGP